MKYYTVLLAIFVSINAFSTDNWLYNNDSTIIEYKLADNTKQIGDWEFYGCNKLKTISLSDSVSSIGIGFCCNSAVSNVYLPKNIQKINDFAFNGCNNLENIILPNSIDSIGDWSFSNCMTLKSIKIPGSTTYIGFGSFYNCASLEELIIPEHLNYIGDWSFSNCKSLRKIYIYAPVSPIIEENAFEFVDKNTCQLIVPESSALAYKSAPFWNEFGSITTGELKTANGNGYIVLANKCILITGQYSKANVLIYNVLGQLMLERQIKTGDIININNIQKGVYIVFIKTDQIIIIRKIIIY